MNFIFQILGISSSQLTFIFFRGAEPPYVGSNSNGRIHGKIVFPQKLMVLRYPKKGNADLNIFGPWIFGFIQSADG